MTNHPTSPTDTPTQVDVLAIGAGPFNLGFAALAQPLVDSGELSLAVLDKRDGFCWHPGMMLPTATTQVPFIADLVTMADPTSPYSFLNYCKQQGRMHHFFIKEDFYPLRAEYSDYCAWVAGQLDTLHWNHNVTRVEQHADGTFTAHYSHPTGTNQVHARHLVIGVGTEPFVPEDLAGALNAPNVLHSADYLHRKEEILPADSITIIGSGQSAAEIYLDLIEQRATQGKRLDWFTRSPRFFPMEYTKLTLEMTSPDYARYFRSLPEATRDRTNREQRNLYKGIFRRYDQRDLRRPLPLLPHQRAAINAARRVRGVVGARRAPHGWHHGDPPPAGRARGIRRHRCSCHQCAHPRHRVPCPHYSRLPRATARILQRRRHRPLCGRPGFLH